MQRLLNVRLSAEDARLVAVLRARGVSISEVVRRALRAEGLRAMNAADDPVAVVDDIIARHPAPDGAERAAPVDTTDRRAVQRHIRGILEAKRAARGKAQAKR